MQSMTGFGRAEGTVGKMRVLFEVRSVNHRHLDLRFRLPAPLSAFETGLAECVREYFERGALEIYCKLKVNPASPSASVTGRFVLDNAALQSLLAVCEEITQKHPQVTGPELSWIVNHPRVVLVGEENELGDDTLKPLQELFRQALHELREMRLREGESLRSCLLGLVGTIETEKNAISALAQDQPKLIEERLRARVQQWNLSPTIDAQRLLQEIALFAERADVTEEIDRLSSHLAQFQELLQGNRPIGRKLDFLTQELYREMNTVGSKAAATEIIRRVVDAKTAIEKLREQLQNVE